MKFGHYRPLFVYDNHTHRVLTLACIDASTDCGLMLKPLHWHRLLRQFEPVWCRDCTEPARFELASNAYGVRYLKPKTARARALLEVARAHEAAEILRDDWYSRAGAEL